MYTDFSLEFIVKIELTRERWVSELEKPNNRKTGKINKTKGLILKKIIANDRTINPDRYIICLLNLSRSIPPVKLPKTIPTEDVIRTTAITGLAILKYSER